MNRASRTVNPLHFEDLEPHRFEDLVRQLAYTYRTWRYLDATGRLGRDGGLDIRGVELVTVPSALQDEITSDDLDQQEAEAAPSEGQAVEERVWSIQCKRYREIGPTLMREIVGETIPDPSQAPYGLIIAAACDVSAETLAVLREEAFARGVSEAHPWTKAHLEDKLFQPQNDHLLFAYFGLSISIRRQSQLVQIRSNIVIKRKLMRALKQEITNQVFREDALIRDISDTCYPHREQVPEFSEMRAAPWHVARVRWLHPKGLIVWRFGYDGWLTADGMWDILEDSRMINSSMGHHYWRADEDWQAEAEARKRRTTLIGHIPEPERKHIWEQWLLPFSHILEVDPIGDALIEGPHLYCRFDGHEGPYFGPAQFETMGKHSGQQIRLQADKRMPLFTELAESVSLSGSSEATVAPSVDEANDAQST